MRPIVKEIEENGVKRRYLACPYCDDQPLLRELTPEGLAEVNKKLNERRHEIPLYAGGPSFFYYEEEYNYTQGAVCPRCGTLWLYDANKRCIDTYPGNVPMANVVVTICGKTYPCFLPLKDYLDGRYWPRVHPLAPLIMIPQEERKEGLLRRLKKILKGKR